MTLAPRALRPRADCAQPRPLGSRRGTVRPERPLPDAALRRARCRCGALRVGSRPAPAACGFQESLAEVRLGPLAFHLCHVHPQGTPEHLEKRWESPNLRPGSPACHQAKPCPVSEQGHSPKGLSHTLLEVCSTWMPRHGDQPTTHTCSQMFWESPSTLHLHKGNHRDP